MGYNTDFSGVLKFVAPLAPEKMEELDKFLQADCRDHPEWGAKDLTYIDLEYTPNKDGLQWDGSEKTYDLVEKVNLILTQMRKKWPGFGLEGQLIAQGEDMMDRWILIVEEYGWACRKELSAGGKEITCPYCKRKFI